MAGWKGHFDRRLFQAFVRTVGIYPVGALVRLSDDHLAVVAEQNEKVLLTPKVVVVFDCKRRRILDPVALDLADGDRRIVCIEKPEDWALGDLDALWSGVSTTRQGLFS